MKKSKYSRTLILSYLLGFYILIQFSWWSYLIIDLYKKANILETRISVLLGTTDPSQISDSFIINRKLWMIFAEGAVFLTILLYGINKIQKSIKKELEVTEQQRNFMLSITHELKTPLASTKLFIDTLKKRKLDESKKIEIFDRIDKDNDRLTRLVDKILMATNIENDNLPPEKQKLDLSEFLEDLIKFASSSSGKDHKTESDIQREVLFNFDPLMLTSVFQNLYDNAVKYSEKGSVIFIGLKETSDQIIVSFKDEGQGIPSEEKTKIFQRFYRSENEETRKTKGTGLGLFIVHQLVRAHNGVIEISSNHPKGSIFEVKFNKNGKQK